MVKLLGSCIISATSSKNWVLVLVKQRWMYTVIIVAVELCIVQLVVNSHGTHTLGVLWARELLYTRVTQFQ